MKYRRAAATVTWAFASSVCEEKNLCNNCKVKHGPNCPRNKLLPQYESMTAVKCVFFYAINEIRPRIINI